jgi:DNA-directed RNA polymerase specialized sigma24 family protein
MVVNFQEFVEMLTRMLYAECKKRGLFPDEDVLQEVLLWSWISVKRLYSKDKGVKLSTYLWKVVDSTLKDSLRRRVEELRNVSFEELREDDNGEVKDWYLEDRREESFSSKLLKLLKKYWGLVGEDFLKLMVGDVDVSNALRSLSASKRRGEEWIEWWLGRKLNEEERRCCQEVKELLSEV